MPSELGDFLRARRTDPGLEPHPGNGRRRRITGLRREEVATAAGVSVDYYTRLEQGRETHPSAAVLDALATALQLTADGREHLHRLREARTAAARHDAGGDAALAARMAALVDAVRPHPAYVLDRMSNVIAANPEGLALHIGMADLPADQRNTCRYLLTDPRATQTFVEWEDIARGAVANLRAANADDLHAPALETLVAELRECSPLFEGWWANISSSVAARRSPTSVPPTSASCLAATKCFICPKTACA